MEEKSFIQTYKRSILVLILVNLAISTCIIVGDLKTLFEGYGVILLEAFLHIQIIFSTIILTWIVYRSIKHKLGSLTSFFWLILGTVVFIWLVPSVAVKILAPIYDSYYEQKALTELTRIIALYQEPTYLPPQVTFDGKTINTGLANGVAHITTTYRCIEPYNYPWDSNTIKVELLSSRKNVDHQDHGFGEIIKINDKDTFLYNTSWGRPHLIFYGETLSREVYVSEKCILSSEDVIKIMESLQPVVYKDAILFKQKPKGPEDRFFD